jgi:uncharacterized protein (TIRG00374 family)
MQERPKRKRVGMWRQILLLAIFFGITVFVILGFTSAHEFGHAMASASWEWMLVSAVLFAVSFYFYAWVYQLGLAAADVHLSTPRLLGPLMVSIFLNTAAPVGEAIFVEYAVESGQSGAKAAAGSILGLAVDLGTTVPFIVGGLAFLGAAGKLPPYYVIVSALFVFVVALMFAALWVGKVRPAWLRALLAWSQRAVNYLAVHLLKRPRKEPGDWAARNAEQFSAAAASMTKRPRILLLASLVGLLFHAVNTAGLFTLCLSFGQRVGIGTVLAAFSMSVVLYVVAVTPQGAGPTEGVMALLFTSMGVGSAIAVVIAITYRIFNVWIPILLGYLVARRMRIFGGRSGPSAAPEAEA